MATLALFFAARIHTALGHRFDYIVMGHRYRDTSLNEWMESAAVFLPPARRGGQGRRQRAQADCAVAARALHRFEKVLGHQVCLAPRTSERRCVSNGSRERVHG